MACSSAGARPGFGGFLSPEPESMFRRPRPDRICSRRQAQKRRLALAHPL